MSDGMHIDFDQVAFRQFKNNKRLFIKEVLSKANQDGSFYPALSQLLKQSQAILTG